MYRVWLLAVVACSFEHGRFEGPGSGSAVTDARLADARPVDARPIDARPLDATPTCPGNYTLNSGSHYRYVTQSASWTSAETDCENDGFGTHLVVAVTGTEVGTVDAISSATNVWVGETDRITIGSWKWVSGETAFNLGAFTNTRCGKYYHDGGNGSPGLQSDDCATTHPYVCECDLTEPDPTSF